MLCFTRPAEAPCWQLLSIPDRPRLLQLLPSLPHPDQTVVIQEPLWEQSQSLRTGTGSPEGLLGLAEAERELEQPCPGAPGPGRQTDRQTDGAAPSAAGKGRRKDWQCQRNLPRLQEHPHSPGNRDEAQSGVCVVKPSSAHIQPAPPSQRAVRAKGQLGKGQRGSAVTPGQRRAGSGHAEQPHLHLPDLALQLKAPHLQLLRAGRVRITCQRKAAVPGRIPCVPQRSVSSHPGTQAGGDSRPCRVWQSC